MKPRLFALLVCAFQCLFSACQSLANVTFLSLFLNSYLDADDDRDIKVGIAQACNGLAVLLIAWPAGVAVDKWKNKFPVLVRLLIPIGVLSALLMIWGVLTESLPLMFASQSLNGLWYGWTSTVFTTMLVECSIPDELLENLIHDPLVKEQPVSRSRTYGWYGSADLLGNSLGPLVAFILFAGNSKGSVDQLKIVLLIGNLALAATMVMLCATPKMDKISLPMPISSDLISQLPITESSKESPTKEPTGDFENETSSVDFPALVDSASVDNLLTAWTSQPTEADFVSRSRWVPWAVFASELVFAIGAGQTIAFIPLFFSSDLDVSDELIALVFVVNPLLSALATWFVSGPMAKRFSTPALVLLLNFIGTSGLLALWAIRAEWVAIVVFWFRTASLNCTSGIQRAFILGLVPPAQHGRWNARENVTSFTWSGSALIGGFLAERFGYRFTFLITATLYYSTCLIWFPIMRWNWRRIGIRKAATEREKAENSYFEPIKLAQVHNNQSDTPLLTVQ